ncbi:hypothetical protein K2173_013744 [Erythroxylum novogranatense]|uniref:RING-type domain-containing protein n=1 Tax=Erythroxylum novogranatense TaxID=1862640 RepID=A0AAV8SA93_9ROSI|nr:hypothetical protein K2173_013744 [Erythroxylum novogranatense]
MGQNLVSQSQSRDELLYQLVTSGDVNSIRALCREGANLEWIDQEGKTPLIVACMDSGLFNVAKALIELGANVDAYRPGRHAGTPLHHAAKRGLHETVNLLLSSGANALVRNDDCHTALDVARIKGYTNVVRAIENHIGFFSGWLREFFGPGFLEALAHKFLSRKVWAVVTPCGSSNPSKPPRLQLAIYPTLQESQPRTIISLWKAKIEEPKFHQPDPGLIIFDQPTETRYKFAPEKEGDKQQLHWLYDACRGVSQILRRPVNQNTPTEVSGNENLTSVEAVELAMALNASIQSAREDRPDTQSEGSARGDSLRGWDPAASSSGWINEATNAEYNGWGIATESRAQTRGQTHTNTSPVVLPNDENSELVLPAPSAPPVPAEALEEGPVHYPSIDSSPVYYPSIDSSSLNFSVPAIEHGASEKSDMKDGEGSSSCIVCWEAPIEGACVPCGHMVGCMTCLSEIKTQKGVCPVCRTKLNQVLRLYTV